MKPKDWYVYIVEGKDGTLYTGITTDLVRRVNTHNAKKGSKSLRGKIPVVLAYHKLYNSHSEALKREAEIKNWDRNKKLELIRSTGH